MQTRTIGWIISASVLLTGLAGCRNLPRGGGGALGLRKAPEVRTIAGIGDRSDRPAIREQAPSTISSRVDPPSRDASRDQVMGKVLDDRGIPVANARVRLAVDGSPAGLEVEGTTNRSGQFLLKGLRPGERYILIAEWDDGREFLIGRSSISAPAEEVRIRVASAGSGSRAEVTSRTRFDSSGVTLFNPDRRPPDRQAVDAVPLQKERIDRSAGSPTGPDQDLPVRSRSRSGWIPSDSVRRASLDPDLDFERPSNTLLNRPGPDSGFGDETDFDYPSPSLDGTSVAGSVPSQRPIRLDPSPEMRPRPGTFDPSSSTIGSLEDRTPRADSRSPSTVRYRGQNESLPTVQHFEPESEQEFEQPDPPLLMTDSPPVIEPDTADDEASNPEGTPTSTPGSMHLAPAPTPVPIPIPGDSPSEAPTMVLLPDEPTAGGADSKGRNKVPEEPSTMGPEAADRAIEFIDPDRLPDVSSTLADVADSGDGAGAGPEDRTEPRSAIRWADLPPPDRSDPGTAGTSKDLKPPGDKGWAAGLLRLVSRDQGAQPGTQEVEPVVQYDVDRASLVDFTLPDLRGRPYQLREDESEYVLLCFWGTWCDPCLAAMPHLDELQRQFGPDRLRVVSIAYERDGEGGPRSLARTSRRLGLSFPILIAPGDGSCPVAEAMEVQYYPTMILLDRDGRVVHRETGATGEKLMRLDRAITEAMGTSIMTITRR